MIDFRYHLVSLVAVFMALAVGILLGAGPLRGGLGATLEGQVNELREERNVLRSELDQSQERAADREVLIDTLGPAAVDRRLTGVRVGVLVLPEADESLIEGVDEAIAAAGGDLVVTIRLDESTESEGDSALRAEVVDQVAGTLALPESADGAASLAAVVAATAIGSDPEGQVGQWRTAQAVLEDNDLISVDWSGDSEDESVVTDRRPPEAIVVLSAPLSSGSDSADQNAEPLAARLDLVGSLGALGAPTVIVSNAADLRIDGDTRVQDELIAAVREDATLADQVSTVDNVGLTSGQIVTALALGWELTGVSGHYGFGPDADGVTPSMPAVRVVEDPWQNGSPQPGGDAPGGTGSNGSGPNDGALDEGTTNEGTTDEGTANNGTSDEGTAGGGGALGSDAGGLGFDLLGESTSEPLPGGPTGTEGGQGPPGSDSTEVTDAPDSARTTSAPTQP